jgi:hypothetical protein
MPTPHPATNNEGECSKSDQSYHPCLPRLQKGDFLDTGIVVDLAQQSLTQIKMALAGPNAFLAQ